MASSWIDVNYGDNVEERLNDGITQVMEAYRQLNMNSSGLTFRSMLQLDIQISSLARQDNYNMKNYELFEKSKISKFGHNFDIDMTHLNLKMFKGTKSRKNSILDIKGSGNKCLIYCIAASKMYDKIENEITRQQSTTYVEYIAEKMTIEKINFPTPWCDIQNFLDKNESLDLDLNIYVVNEYGIEAMKTKMGSNGKPGNHTCNLLAIFPVNDESGADNVELQPAHFVLINNLDLLMTETDDSGRCMYRVICPKCKMKFSSKTCTKYKEHSDFCTNSFDQIQNMPEHDFKLKFRDFDRQYLNELCIFFDLECLLTESQKNSHCGHSCFGLCKCPTDETKFTKVDEIHQPIIYSYCIVDCEGKLIHQRKSN